MTKAPSSLKQDYDDMSVNSVVSKPIDNASLRIESSTYELHATIKGKLFFDFIEFINSL